MNQKLFDHAILYDDGSEFFRLKGNACMALTPKAAIEVCEEATARGVYIGTIEGGHWRNPGFQPDMNTRWDSLKYYKDIDIKLNNDIAIENINGDVAEGYTAFLITIISKLSD